MKSKIQRYSDYIDHLQSTGHYYFDRKDAKQVFQKTQSALDLALYRLVKKGRVARVRGDFYIIIPHEYRAIASLPASWFIDPFMRFMDTKYYVALLSAAEFYGATHQQVMTFQVITNKIVRPIKIGSVRIEFHYQKNIPDKFIHSVKTETGNLRLGNPEVTVCDLLKYINASGQIHNVATVLCELKDRISMEDLVNYLQSFSVGVVYIQRLGYLLDYLDLGIDTNLLQECLSEKKPEYRPLVAGSETPIVEKNKRWHILVNEKIETDL